MDSTRMTFIWVGLFVGFRDLPISSASWKILTKVAFICRGQQKWSHNQAVSFLFTHSLNQSPWSLNLGFFGEKGVPPNSWSNQTKMMGKDSGIDFQTSKQIFICLDFFASAVATSFIKVGLSFWNSRDFSSSDFFVPRTSSHQVALPPSFRMPFWLKKNKLKLFFWRIWESKFWIRNENRL